MEVWACNYMPHLTQSLFSVHVSTVISLSSLSRVFVAPSMSALYFDRQETKDSHGNSKRKLTQRSCIPVAGESPSIAFLFLTSPKKRLSSQIQVKRRRNAINLIKIVWQRERVWGISGPSSKRSQYEIIRFRFICLPIVILSDFSTSLSFLVSIVGYKERGNKHWQVFVSGGLLPFHWNFSTILDTTTSRSFLLLQRKEKKKTFSKIRFVLKQGYFGFLIFLCSREIQFFKSGKEVWREI